MIEIITLNPAMISTTIMCTRKSFSCDRMSSVVVSDTVQRSKILF